MTKPRIAEKKAISRLDRDSGGSGAPVGADFGAVTGGFGGAVALEVCPTMGRPLIVQLNCNVD